MLTHCFRLRDAARTRGHSWLILLPWWGHSWLKPGGATAAPTRHTSWSCEWSSRWAVLQNILQSLKKPCLDSAAPCRLNRHRQKQPRTINWFKKSESAILGFIWSVRVKADDRNSKPNLPKTNSIGFVFLIQIKLWRKKKIRKCYFFCFWKTNKKKKNPQLTLRVQSCCLSYNSNNNIWAVLFNVGVFGWWWMKRKRKLRRKLQGSFRVPSGFWRSVITAWRRLME